jgi:hypothetical protein
MQSPAVIAFVNEAAQIRSDILEDLLIRRLDHLDLRGLDEILHLALA